MRGGGGGGRVEEETRGRVQPRDSLNDGIDEADGDVDDGDDIDDDDDDDQLSQDTPSATV